MQWIQQWYEYLIKLFKFIFQLHVTDSFHSHLASFSFLSSLDFQLHVTDSRGAGDYSNCDLVVLSTPCNGFPVGATTAEAGLLVVLTFNSM